MIQLLILRIICCRHIPDPAVEDHPVYFLFLSGLWIVNTDRMAAVCIYQLHAGDIRITVPDIDHIPKRHAHLLRRKIFIYTGIIDVKHALFNPEQALCLTCIVDDLCRPHRHAARIIVERTGINFFKRAFFCDLRTLDHLLETGRDDIMLHDHTMLFSIRANPLKPLRHTRKQLHLRAVPRQAFPAEDQLSF